MAAGVVDIDRLLEVRPGFRGGRPCLRGTGITVHTIAAHHLQGMSPEEILDGFPQASLAGIHAALAYYYVHSAEVDADSSNDRVLGDQAIERQEREWDEPGGRNIP
ncbi:MAG: DUF433 domain-containing protein [Dehalococcoidia bacterium]|nr:DUF433 domain-containing protein [Dehalococcoidia bacterium]